MVFINSIEAIREGFGKSMKALNMPQSHVSLINYGKYLGKITFDTSRNFYKM